MILLGELLCVIFGILSNVIWMFVYVPQFLKNISQKNVEAVSFLMILFALTGDILSYISSKAKHLSYVIIFGSFYHSIFSSILLSQWIYYKIRNYEDRNILSISSVSRDLCKNINFYFSICFLLILSVIRISSESGLIENPIFFDYLAWCSTLIFIIARIPQIILNYKRKTIDGLSKWTFIMICFANTLFFISLIVKMIDLNDNERQTYIKDNLQWIFGCTITTIFDFVILYQFKIYSNYIVLV